MQKRGGKIAVISGGAGGIGRSLALKLAELIFQSYWTEMRMRERRHRRRFKRPGSKVSFIAPSLGANDKLPKPLPKYWPNTSELTLS